MAGNVYFIRDCSFVKIGYAEEPESRLAELQCGNPRKLELAAVLPDVEMQIEQLFHRVFARYRHRGEWFKYHKTLRAVVNLISEGARPGTEGEIRTLISLHNQVRKAGQKRRRDRQLKKLFWVELEENDREGARMIKALEE